ncbi:uncharacterized protein PGTG_20813 [Puccinia graminis f. sp. tritici CRL 75-36-700-3]|uniref:Uncharacterized protein n=1 Tax=Puccinia graminis f. sp. tritici (strain CRL 75-36-700-3 / race SCCL) TaxID=418459 RepID=H6QPR9_PUCGT|nr:uncharacterized protein PGTG_20813 [Puccinia graminis f. sp. tritici CRL 75-36-700-3]EHS64113.1 hypothetical protein PGTG_20813 [Puccinia graminis f. sp. tritici CRL 75-36-700-3]
MLVARHSEMKVSDRSPKLPEPFKEIGVHLEPNFNCQKKKHVVFVLRQLSHTPVLHLQLGAITDSMLNALKQLK